MGPGRRAAWLDEESAAVVGGFSMSCERRRRRQTRPARDSPGNKVVFQVGGICIMTPRLNGVVGGGADTCASIDCQLAAVSTFFFSCFFAVCVCVCSGRSLETQAGDWSRELGAASLDTCDWFTEPRPSSVGS